MGLQSCCQSCFGGTIVVVVIVLETGIQDDGDAMSITIAATMAMATTITNRFEI
jgi:hypothetical protein